MRRLASALLLALTVVAIPQQLPGRFKTTVAPKLNPPFRQMLPNLRTRTPILTYHDIIERRDSKSLWFDCSVDEFKAQLDWLTAHHARFITLDQLYAHLVGGAELPPHAIAITFADNYEGFYLRAFPILKARRIPV
ncbi:MAG TPA: hypothetical protein VG820_09040, partial [Fimbriimonadaceae bacterium]|nr:hypothetical protein [Fimbriimonadaceae bacterium]